MAFKILNPKSTFDYEFDHIHYCNKCKHWSGPVTKYMLPLWAPIRRDKITMNGTLPRVTVSVLSF